MNNIKINNENVSEMQKVSNNNSNLLNKVKNNYNKIIKRIDTLDNKCNIKIKEIEEQTKIYKNKFSDIKSELNKLRKEIAMKKLDEINIIYKK